jgi:NAD+ diphosphatase
MSIDHNLYAGGTLDRVSALRKDEDWLAAKLADPRSRLTPVWRNHSLVADPDSDRPRLAEPPVSVLDWAELGAPAPILLGLEGETAWFTLDLSALEQPETLPGLAGQGRFVELRSVGARLPRDQASLAAYARGLAWWHQRHGFCGVCGTPTRSAEAGHVRLCTAPGCGASHFPRTDPAVIMLVTDGERCLLGRQPRFPPGFYSTFAGFVEPGESLEEAVIREVLEETGIRVGDVRYHSSQPWPFPSSLMLGFRTRALSTEIRVAPGEIEEARWFERSWLRANRKSDSFSLPRFDSVSRRLIEDWLAEG